MVSQPRKSDSVFIFTYRDGNLEYIPVSGKKSNEPSKYEKFILKLKSIGNKKS
jgi:hypothetical protein